MRWAPFTAKIKVSPARPGKRFEQIRDLQRISSQIYDALASESTLNFALPSGGQARSFGRYSDYVNGGAVTPQMGASPPLVSLTGYYQISSNNVQPYADHATIHAGDSLSGPGSDPWEINPQTATANEVKALKTLIETTINAASPTFDYSIFRIDYAGIIWGDRGFHWPR